VDDGKFIHEVNLSPGSLHDLSSPLLLPLDLPEGAELYMDRGYDMKSSCFLLLSRGR
jgi:hypothetical protein